MNKEKYNFSLSIIGAGHVGLVVAAGFAHLNYQVFCVDNDKQKIESLKKGIVPFYEPGLDKLVKDNLKKKRLFFSTDVREAILKSNIIFISVNTPPLSDGSADLSSVENVSRIIAENLNGYKLIISKSTVPVHTGEKIKNTILNFCKKKTQFDVASNPEFLREGKAVYDFFYPERIVLGVESKRAEKILKELYRKIKAPLIITDITTAELIKHACNSFLATKISFINAIARICDLAKADIKKISEAMGLDSRIGKEFLQAGIGYGGFCFPKDLEAFIYIGRKLGYEFDLLKEVRRINEEQKNYFAQKIKDELWVLKEKKISILGGAFKPNTDDIRFAPAIDLINFFLKEEAKIFLYDPKANREFEKVFGNRIFYGKNAYEILEKSDCLCLVTEWEEFKKLDFKKIYEIMHYKFIADGRNFLDKEKLIKIGFKYIGIGQ